MRRANSPLDAVVNIRTANGVEASIALTVVAEAVVGPDAVTTVLAHAVEGGEVMAIASGAGGFAVALGDVKGVVGAVLVEGACEGRGFVSGAGWFDGGARGDLTREGDFLLECVDACIDVVFGKVDGIQGGSKIIAGA